jgi:hypothetical protein
VKTPPPLPGISRAENAPGFLTLYNDSLPAEFFFAQKEDVLIFVRITPLKCQLQEKIYINVKRGIVMSDRLIFLLFVSTRKPGHLTRGSQEVL